MKFTTASAAAVLIATASSVMAVQPCVAGLTATSSEKDLNKCVKEIVDAEDATSYAPLAKKVKDDLVKRVTVDSLRKVFQSVDGKKAFFPIITKLNAETVQNAIANHDELVEEIINLRTPAQWFGRGNKVIAVDNYEWVPKHFLSKAENVAKLFAHFKSTNAGKTQEFLTMFTTKQITIITQKPDFHNGELTPAALNAFLNESDKRSKAFLKALESFKMSFISSLYKSAQGSKAVKLEEKVAKHMPKNYLKELDFVPHPDDAKYFNETQAKSAKKLVKNIDMNAANKKTIRGFENGKAIKRVAKKANEETLSKFSADQWNTLFKDTKNCEYLKTTKIDNVSKINFSPECFANLTAEIQSFVLTKHTNLKDNVLSKVVKSQTEEWFHEKSSDSGLAVLNHIASKNKDAIIANLGSSKHIDDDEHPCFGMTLSEIADIKSLASNMSRKAVDALTIEELTKDDLKEHAAIIAKREGAFDMINDMNADLDDADDEKAAKKNVWIKMTKAVFAQLASAGTTIAADMTKEIFDIIPAANRAEMKGHFVAQLTFLKDLTAADYATLSETAFDKVTKAMVASVRVADMTDVQLSNLSVAVADVADSAFAGIATAEIAKLSVERLALLKSRQWAPISAASFKAVFVGKEAIAAVPAASTTTWTAAQMKDIAPEAISAITAEQVEVMGSEIADAKLSASAFLIANKSLLAADSLVALCKRFPEVSGASALNVSAAAFAAIATLAFLA